MTQKQQWLWKAHNRAFSIAIFVFFVIVFMGLAMESFF